MKSRKYELIGSWNRSLLDLLNNRIGLQEFGMLNGRDLFLTKCHYIFTSKNEGDKQ